MERIAKIISILLFAVSIISCSEESEEATAKVTLLEGKWKSQCYTGFGGFGSVINDTSVLSFQLQQVFENDTFDVLFANYSDDTCSTLDKEFDPETSTSVAPSFPIPTGFTLGKQLTTIEGDVVTELDFTFEDGSIKKDIFLLQDNTLYFGLPGTDCNYITTIEDFHTCADIRPETINFYTGYALDGNPVVASYDFIRATEPYPTSYSVTVTHQGPVFPEEQSFPIPTGFTLGKQLTTIDGDVVTEIDFTFEDGSIKKDIYLLHDNTLYLGLPGTDCLYITTIEEFLACADIRPETIDFYIGYALDGNPVDASFDFIHATQPYPDSYSSYTGSITATEAPSLPVPVDPLP